MPAVACPLCRGDAEPGRVAATVDAEAVRSALKTACDQGATSITLRDGDLLARPEALDLLAEARSGGVHGIEVWTSGLLLAQPGAAQRVGRAGASHVAAPLFGDSAASHDYVAGQPGHFQRTLAGLKRARAAGLHTVVLAPILRATYRNLPQLIQKSLALDVSAFRLVAALGQDRPRHPLLAPLAMSMNALQAALQVAQAAARPATVLDVPACLLGEGARWLATPVIVATTASADAHEHGRACELCSWRGRCPGLPVGLARQHGWQGLVARSDDPP
jgi:hypothetical protein